MRQLPVVVSREMGCVADLVQDGLNGYTPPRPGTSWARLCSPALDWTKVCDDSKARRLIARILQWGYQQVLEGIRGAGESEFRGPETDPMSQTNSV